MFHEMWWWRPPDLVPRREVKSMSQLEKDGLKACLFSRQDRVLLNMKVFRGDGTRISPEDLAVQILSIDRQHAAGLEPAAGPVRSMKPTVDVRKLVAGL